MSRIVWLRCAALVALVVPVLCGCGGGGSQQAATAGANTGSRVGILTILAISAFLVVVTYLGDRRMKALKLDLDDSQPAD